MLYLAACGGSGSRLSPATKFVNKHLLPVGDGDLMVDLPLRFLSWHNIKEASVVTGTNHASQVMDHIEDGARYGFSLVEYFAQPRPAGISDVLNRVSHRDVEDGVVMILGDNYFEKPQESLASIVSRSVDLSRAVAWEYDIGDSRLAQRFGQAFRDEHGELTDIIEKPAIPSHPRILVGLYYFPGDVFEYVAKLSPSARGELEITSLLKSYLKMGRLDIHVVEGKWADLGEWGSWQKFVGERYLDGSKENRLE